MWCGGGGEGRAGKRGPSNGGGEELGGSNSYLFMLLQFSDKFQSQLQNWPDLFDRSALTCRQLRGTMRYQIRDMRQARLLKHLE